MFYRPSNRYLNVRSVWKCVVKWCTMVSSVFYLKTVLKHDKVVLTLHWRLTLDLIQWFQYDFGVIRAVRINESFYNRSHSSGLIRVWITGRHSSQKALSAWAVNQFFLWGLKKGNSSAFYHGLFAGSRGGISSLCHVVDYIVFQLLKTTLEICLA